MVLSARNAGAKKLPILKAADYFNVTAPHVENRHLSLLGPFSKKPEPA
jgi:hypothetical protein